jgi:cyclophilin family peptidyl-prolyl cis-trans isomerase
MKILAIIAVLAVVAGLGWYTYQAYQSGQPAGTGETATTTSPAIPNLSHLVTIKTNHGEIQFVTYDADAPQTVANFLTLARAGFYDGVIFHRVIDGFMIQGGDPTGTGRGGPGYAFADELNPATPSYQAGYRQGVVAMANAGPNTNGSQFFIMVADYPLPHNYTIFGQVTAGQAVANAIAKLPTDADDRPLAPVVMESVTVIDNQPANQV